MSTYYISSLSKPNNNSGVVLRASSASGVLNNVAIPLNTDILPFGSVVVDGVNTNTALSLGNFAYNNQRPIIKGTTISLNGDSFSSSAIAVSTTGHAKSELISSIHPMDSVRTRLDKTAMREGRYNGVTGKFDAGYPDVQLDDLGVDIAGKPSRSNHGRINFIHGKRLISTSYDSKTG